MLQSVRVALAAIAIAWLLAGAPASANGVDPPLRLAQAAPKATLPQQQEKPPQSAVAEAEARIADLRRRLSINQAQQAQFDALAQAMRQNAQDLDALAQQEQPKGKLSAVEAMRIAGRFAEAESAGVKRLLPPLQALYGSLSDQQKRAADDLFASGPPQPEQPPSKKR